MQCVRTKRCEDIGQWHLEETKELAKHLLVREENELVIERIAYLTQQVVETAQGSCGHKGQGGSGKTYGLQQQFASCQETVRWLAPMNTRVGPSSWTGGRRYGRWRFLLAVIRNVARGFFFFHKK